MSRVSIKGPFCARRVALLFEGLVHFLDNEDQSLDHEHQGLQVKAEKEAEAGQDDLEKAKNLAADDHEEYQEEIH